MPADKHEQAGQPATKSEEDHPVLHAWIGPALKVAMGLGALLLVVEGNFEAAFETLLIMAITFLPGLLGRQYHLRIPRDFGTLALVFIYLSLFLGEVQGYYVRFWWWDLVLHAGSGFLSGITGFLLVFALNQNKRINMHLTPGFIALFAFMFALGIGALWEIFEFCMDSLLGMNMQKSGLVDTMWDLIVNCIGALLISMLGYGYLKTNEVDSFLERMIQRFIANNPRLFRRRRK